ncbi:MAG: hypothetical protein LBU15_01005 [Rickettsiales bacterium]|jgi:hypothetical protein|nr:hypothetical protein [Rickettsiales bacterium]
MDSPRAGEGSLERNSREENREDKPREMDRNASGQSSTRENSQRGLNTPQGELGVLEGPHRFLSSSQFYGE